MAKKSPKFSNKDSAQEELKEYAHLSKKGKGKKGGKK